LKAVNISQKTPVPRGRYQCPPKITLTLKYVNRGIKDLQNPRQSLQPTNATYADFGLQLCPSAKDRSPYHSFHLLPPKQGWEFNWTHSSSSESARHIRINVFAITKLNPGATALRRIYTFHHDLLVDSERVCGPHKLCCSALHSGNVLFRGHTGDRTLSQGLQRRRT
jgi:hypothetical protein